MVALFASFFATSAFASTVSTGSRHPNAVSGTSTWLDCNQDWYDNGLADAPVITYVAGGNASGCPNNPSLLPNPAYFETIEFPQYGYEGTVGNWTDTAISTTATVASCNIYAQFPYGNYSSDTKTRYDFWYGSHWLGWPGHDINQYSIAAGLQPIATNLPVNGSGAQVIVTARDDGGSGWLALAAVKFSCTYSNL